MQARMGASWLLRWCWTIFPGAGGLYVSPSISLENGIYHVVYKIRLNGYQGRGASLDHTQFLQRAYSLREIVESPDKGGGG